jgi:hypothetical protein
MNYWEECISLALDEVGIVATQDQIKTIAGFVEGGHENYGMAHGHDCIPNPVELENSRLSKALQIEKDKIICEECQGRGSITNYGPYHQATSQCWKCRGEGRYTR